MGRRGLCISAKPTRTCVASFVPSSPFGARVRRTATGSGPAMSARARAGASATTARVSRQRTALLLIGHHLLEDVLVGVVLEPLLGGGIVGAGVGGRLPAVGRG